jgi:hypothetical protein
LAQEPICLPVAHLLSSLPPLPAATYINASVAVDDNNTAKVIYKCNPGNK